MSDESAPGAAAGGPAREAGAGAATFEISHQYIKDLSFEVPGAPAIFQTHAAPEVNVNVDVAIDRLEEKRYEVALKMEARGTVEGKPLFVAELVYAGLFRLGDVPADQIQPLLLIEAPRLLFPFARNILAGVTRDGGLPPLMVSPIDFVGMYRRRLAMAQEKAAEKPKSADNGAGSGA